MKLVKVSFVVRIDEYNATVDLNDKQSIVDLLNKAGGPGALFDNFNIDNIEATKEITE